jgi:exosortase
MKSRQQKKPRRRGDVEARGAVTANASRPGAEERGVGDRLPHPSEQASVGSWRFAQAVPDGFWAVCGLVLAAAFAWAYWPTLVSLVGAWNREPDYSHGFFVVPLAVYFLWARRDRYPGTGSGKGGSPDWGAAAPGTFGKMGEDPASGPAWLGLGLVAASVVVRFYGARFYLDALDGWSIMFWVAGVAWLLGGWRVMGWAAPSIAFLWFMVPLPYRMERWLSLPLQGAATKLSCWILQALGQPALAEGHTIILGKNQLEVEQACSGLRIFVGIVALAFAYAIVMRRAWWEKALLLASAVPIALLANAARIVSTGLLYQYVSGEAAKKFSHDAAGWVMILFAAGLFGLVLLYLSRLIKEVEIVGVGDVVRRQWR